MIKRVSWFVGGAVAGAAGAGYTKKKVKQTAAQLAPVQVAKHAVGSLTATKRRIGEAISDGRSAMRAKEAELRARRDGRTSTLADHIGERRSGAH